MWWHVPETRKTPTNSCYSCWHWVGCSVRWSVFHELQWPWLGREAPCGSSSDFLLIHINLVCEPCMYALSPPPLHISSFLYFILSLTPIPHTHPSFFPPSHSSLTPHTPHPHSSHSLLALLTLLTHSSHWHWECVSSDGVGTGWQTKETAPPPHTLTPSHSHIEQSWSRYGHLYYNNPLLCVCVCVWDTCMRRLSVGLGKLFWNNLRIIGATILLRIIWK